MDKINWIDKKNKIQHEWICNYLNKNLDEFYSLFSSSQSIDKEFFGHTNFQLLESLKFSEESKTFVVKMNNAWRQFVYHENCKKDKLRSKKTVFMLKSYIKKINIKSKINNISTGGAIELFIDESNDLKRIKQENIKLEAEIKQCKSSKIDYEASQERELQVKLQKEIEELRNDLIELRKSLTMSNDKLETQNKNLRIKQEWNLQLEKDCKLMRKKMNQYILRLQNIELFDKN